MFFICQQVEDLSLISRMQFEQVPDGFGKLPFFQCIPNSVYGKFKGGVICHGICLCRSIGDRLCLNSLLLEPGNRYLNDHVFPANININPALVA